MAGKYAHGTSIGIERSREELERILARYGREQAPVNAQVDVGRAVFLMNAYFNFNKDLPPYNTMTEEDFSDQKILKHIDDGIKDLKEAREGYFKGQLKLFGEEDEGSQAARERAWVELMKDVKNIGD